MTDIECILACPEHGPQFKIVRAPTGRGGCFENKCVTMDGGEAKVLDAMCPLCSKLLVREDPNDGT